MSWYKIPVLLVVATANHISLSDQKIAKLRSKSSFIAYSVVALKAFFWTLTVCEVTLIWSVNHLRSPIAHRILVIIVHPWANFPPKPRVSLPFIIVWSITLLSLATYLVSKSYYRRIRQSFASPDQVRDVTGERIQTTRRVLLGSSPVMAVGSTLCYVLPGSFPYECWVWRIRFGGTLFCFMGVSSVVFWLAMIVWRCVRSRRGGAKAPEPVGEASSSDTSPEETTEVLAMENLD